MALRSTRAARDSRSSTTTRTRSATNPHFKHWVPLTALQQSFVGYVPGQKPVLCFHQPADYWHKPPALPSGSWLGEFNLEVLQDADRARELLGLAGRRIAFIGEWQAGFADWGFAAVNPAGLLNELHYDRAVKTPYELECMRRASLMAARGHVAARDAFTSGASEFETHLAYCAAVGQRDEELPYGNIIAFNENAAVLHYQHLDHEPRRPAPVLPDRRRCAVPRLRRGHHAHLLGRATGNSPTSCAEWTSCNWCCVPRSAAGRTIARSTCSRTG